MRDLSRASLTWKKRKNGTYDGSVKGVPSRGTGEQIHAFVMKPSSGKALYSVTMTIRRRHQKWGSIDNAFYQFRARTLASVKKKANSLLRNQNSSFARVHRVKSFSSRFERARPEHPYQTKAPPRGHPARGLAMYWLGGE